MGLRSKCLVQDFLESCGLLLRPLSKQASLRALARTCAGLQGARTTAQERQTTGAHGCVGSATSSHWFGGTGAGALLRTGALAIARGGKTASTANWRGGRAPDYCRGGTAFRPQQCDGTDACARNGIFIHRFGTCGGCGQCPDDGSIALQKCIGAAVGPTAEPRARRS